MKTYDVIVIGSGSGLTIVGEALASGFKVALIDRGPLGGTCLNLGCIPSKMLIFPADRIAEIQDSKKLGIEVEIKQIDFPAIMERMRQSIQTDQNNIRQSLTHITNLDYYETEAHFVKNFTLEVGTETIKANKIFIAGGTRPFIPPGPGIEKIDFLTNESVLKLTQKPESLIIIGGGYIGVEYAHFFAAMGTKVTIIEMANRLIAGEEPEISELLKKSLNQRMEICLNSQVREFRRKDQSILASVKDVETGNETQIKAEAVMIATGRTPNSDLMNLNSTGVEVDKKGFIRVDDYLETTKKNIYAFGDIIGRAMFTHVANREAMQAWHNAMHGEPEAMDYSGVPHAIFSYPQVASVGLTEAEARKSHKVLVGIAKYSEVAKGIAMAEQDGFAKAIVKEETGKILGFHIIGPEAPTLIQEVIDVIAAEGTVEIVHNGMHIHPAMPEVVLRAFSKLQKTAEMELKPERLKATAG